MSLSNALARFSDAFRLTPKEAKAQGVILDGRNLIAEKIDRGYGLGPSTPRLILEAQKEVPGCASRFLRGAIAALFSRPTQGRTEA